MKQSITLRTGLGIIALLYSVVGAWGAPLVGYTWLTAPDGGVYDTFGGAIDVTPDGRTALIGASESTTSSAPGAAYIFSAYATTAGRKLTPANPPADGHFGGPVALADNGTTAVIGASSATVGGNYYQGAAYIFINNSGVWTQQAMLLDPDGAEETFFGCSADIADDGNTVLVASCSNPYMNKTISSVSVFVRAAGTWRLQKKFRGNDTAADDGFGGTVALSGDGNTVLVGAFMDHVGANLDQGSAYVFVRSGEEWSQQAQLTAADGAQWDMFGNVVDLSSDGNLAMIGDSRKGFGVVYVFARSAGKWSQQAKLTPADPDPYYSNFAATLAMSNSGDVAVIGDNQCARLFVRSGGSWREEAKLTISDPEAYGFGGPVALADDGQTILVGASSATVAGNDFQGKVYVFRPFVPMTGADMLLLKSP